MVVLQMLAKQVLLIVRAYGFHMNTKYLSII